MKLGGCELACMDQWSVAEASSRSAAEAPADTAPPLLRDRAASDRPSKLVPSSQATELAGGKSDCGTGSHWSDMHAGGPASHTTYRV